jgi:glycosyltransferase involved in cell wall biosynthesis
MGAMGGVSALCFLFLEPFFGGSHRDFAGGLIAHSRHRIELVTLPDRFWKWRMRGAALYLADRIKDPQRFDGLILSSLMSLADLNALWGRRCPPALVYFHENQLDYPLKPGEAMDYQFGFTNISTALAARQILFNSRSHMSAFLAALPGFIRMMPDCRPNWITKAIAAKAAVAYPGCHFPTSRLHPDHSKERPPLIIWNHRWEHDKNPEVFFRALTAVQRRGIDFRVALLGEAYSTVPPVFESARRRLGDRLVQFGYVPSRRDYYQWLEHGAVVISTALQENFGISIVEAMRHGCLPLLPDRLCYPEILPQAFHADFLYSDQTDLEEKLTVLLGGGQALEDKRRVLADSMTRYAWEQAVVGIDDALEHMVRRSP